jgi:hypothetical protein
MSLDDAVPIVSSSEQYSLQSSSNSEIIRFSANKHLSTIDSNYDHHVEPTLTISDNGTLFAGWKNSETAIGGGARVSFVKSTDGGQHWTRPFDMPMFNIPFPQNHAGLSRDEDVITRQSDPWLIWHSDFLYYAYLEFSLDVPEFSQITVARSNNNGNTWVPVSASFGRGFADKETMWVHFDGTIYVAYDDIDMQGNVTLQVTRSTNNGESFSETSIVGHPDPGHLAPYVTTNSEGHVYIASTFFVNDRGTLLLSRSENMGETFDNPRVINIGYYGDFTSVNGRPSKGTIPVLRFDQNERLYILWADTYEPQDHSFDIYLRYSDDYGDTWSNRYLINPVEEGDQWQPDMDIDSEGNLHIVYYDERDEFYRPYYRRIQFTGESRNESHMSEPFAIADTNTSSEFTRPGDYFTIRLDSDDIPHVVWTDGRHDEMDIYYAHGIKPIPTTPASTTTPTATPTPTNTTDSPDTSTLQILIGFGTGIMLVCIVVVIIYYKTKH